VDFLTKEIIYQKSSQEITSLLYEALIDNTKKAIQGIQANRFIDANENLKIVNDLLERLGVGLNYEAGIIADQLDALYNYMADLVVKANINKDTKLLKEVVAITEKLAEAWQTSINSSKPNQTQQRLLKKANAYEKNIMVYEKDINTLAEGK
jgi:flagellar secretion chaperone FliS